MEVEVGRLIAGALLTGLGALGAGIGIGLSLINIS